MARLDVEVVADAFGPGAGVEEQVQVCPEGRLSVKEPRIAIVPRQVARIETGAGDFRIIFVGAVDQLAAECQQIVARSVERVAVRGDPCLAGVVGQLFSEVERLFLQHDRLTDDIVLCCIAMRSDYMCCDD